MGVDVSAIVSGLDSLRGEDSFRHKMGESFAGLGFSTFTYASVDSKALKSSSDPTLPPDLIYLTNLDPRWTTHYLENGYAQIDPVVRACTALRLPLVWDKSFKSNSRSQLEDVMMRDAWDFGLKKGLTIPIHGPEGEFALVSLNSEIADTEFARTAASARFAAQTLAYYFHDAVQTSFRDIVQTPPPVPLTDREVEILKWTVAGKTAWEIGAILKISERTVNFHIQNVMEKFGVHNKTHAAAKAVNLGLIRD
jgi:DNA-binding CsgD family transcriptional regulator